jgi:3-oxoacyl-[acyl-carrier protein] reductase
MDLGIAGRKAIVCASSKGLGRACAEKLAEAGCEVIVNGRSRDSAEATAADIRKATGARVTAVAADVASPEGQTALFAACPQPDILVTNNLGPPPRDYREVQRVESIPAKRIGRPEEFGATCAFLCSAHAGFITGHNLLIDGGAFPAAFA